MLLLLPPALQRSGNAFLSYNNRNAADVMPLMAPVIAPSARLLGPLLNQIAASPVRSTVEVRQSVLGVGIAAQRLPLTRCTCSGEHVSLASHDASFVW